MHNRQFELRMRNAPPESPLSTKALRDCLARRPLRDYNRDRDPSGPQEEPSDPASSSPPLVKPMTSSPLNGSKSGHLPSPHMSLIRTEPSPGSRQGATESEETLCPSAEYMRSLVTSQFERDGAKTTSPRSPQTPQEKSFETRLRSSATPRKTTCLREKTQPRSLDKDLQECETQGSKKSLLFWILVIGLIPLGLGYYIGWKEKAALPSPDVEAETILVEKLQAWSVSRFSAQDERLWRVLRSSFKKVFAENLNMPACVLLVAQDEKDLTAKRLSIELLTLFLNSTNSTTSWVDPLDASRLNAVSDVEAGRELFDYLENNLRKSRIALVHDVGKLNGRVAMKLHPFCNASGTTMTFPRSIILFTVQNNLDADTKKNRTAEWIAEKLLNSAWEPTIGVDRAASLISRVAATVVDVRSEMSKSL